MAAGRPHFEDAVAEGVLRQEVAQIWHVKSDTDGSDRDMRHRVRGTSPRWRQRPGVPASLQGGRRPGWCGSSPCSVAPARVWLNYLRSRFQLPRMWAERTRMSARWATASCCKVLSPRITLGRLCALAWCQQCAMAWQMHWFTASSMLRSLHPDVCPPAAPSATTPSASHGEHGRAGCLPSLQLLAPTPPRMHPHKPPSINRLARLAVHRRRLLRHATGLLPGCHRPGYLPAAHPPFSRCIPPRP